MNDTEPVPSPKSASRPRVLVLGGGFAGIGAARKLRKAGVDVVVVDGHDYHTFQPLLYQVATDLLPQGTVGHPLRDLFDDQPNARVHTTEVTSVDLDKHEVGFAEMDPLGYDYLVLALGVPPLRHPAVARLPLSAEDFAADRQFAEGWIIRRPGNGPIHGLGGA